MIDTGLKNKVVIVTGANHGIGEATALAFAQQGAKVFINYLRIAPEVFGESNETIREANNPGRAYYCKKISKSADGIVLKIKNLGLSCYAWEADLGDPENIPKLFDLAEDKLGKVDILVNNAATDKLDSFLPQQEIDKNPLFAEEYKMQSITSESFDQNFSVNSRGTALMMAEFTRRHIENNSTWGRIINISTDGAPGHAANISYGASKYAIESYTRAAAIELGPYGITVNVVSPGAVQSGWMPKELETNLSQNYPLRRIGLPVDIANAIIFFSSSQADWITGQVLYVGGGNRM
jgi:3-oxoacyl-[acyl-carrier protein] reductase